MSLSVLNALPSAHTPVEPATQPKTAPAPTVAAAPVQPKADTVSISSAAHAASGDGDHDAS